MQLKDKTLKNAQDAVCIFPNDFEKGVKNMYKKYISLLLFAAMLFMSLTAGAYDRLEDDTNMFEPIPGATDAVNEHMKAFSAVPQYKRDSSTLMYPDDMRTLFSDGRKETVKPEEYEQYMTTEYKPWLKVYHMTTEQQIYQGIKGGEYGQLIYSIAASPFDTNIILLSNNTTGVYKSTDGGKSWNFSSSGLLGVSFDTIAFDPDTEGTVYAVSAGSKGVARFGYLGLYKSEDNGDSWRHVLSIDNAIQVGNYIAFGGKDKNGVRPMYVSSNDITNYNTTGAGYKGIFRSFDKGETWENVGFTDSPVLNIRVAERQNIVFACIIGKGLRASYDNGNTWTDISVNIPFAGTEGEKQDKGDYASTGYVLGQTDAQPNDIADIAIDPYNDKHWIVGTFGIELYESFNEGKSWSRIDSDYGNPQVSEGAFLRTVTFSNYRVNGNTRLFINMRKTVQPVRFSDDNGKSFDYPDIHQEKAYMVKNWHTGWFDEGIAYSHFDSNVVYFGTGSTFRISTDGGTNFYPSSSGYSGAAANDWYFDENGVLKYISMVDTAIWRMADGYEGDFVPVKDNKGRIGNLAAGSSSSSIIVDPNNKNHIFYTLGGGGYARAEYIMESFDGIETYRFVEDVKRIQDMRIEETNDADIRACTFLKYHKTNSNVIYASWFRSYDNGKTWKENDVRILAACEQDNDILYGTDYISTTDPKKIYVSYDRGESWIYTGIIIPRNGKMKCAPDVSEKGVFWCTVYGCVYRIDFNTGKLALIGSNANGISWDNNPRLESYGFAQEPRDPKHLILSTRGIERNGAMPVFESYDSGKTWVRIEGIPDAVAVHAIKFHPTKPQVFMGSMNGTLVYYYEIKQQYDRGKLKEDKNVSEVNTDE